MKTSIVKTMALISLIVLSGCSQSAPLLQGQSRVGDFVGHAGRSEDFVRINRIALLPIESDRSVRLVVGKEQELLDLLEDAAKRGGEFEVVSSHKAGTARLVAATIPSQDILRLGSSLRADAVLQTKIMRYSERKGSRIGSNSPAIVDFTMTLIRVSDGKSVWDGSYHYSDAAISENLFKVSEGPGSGWRTALELLTEGFNSAVQDLATRRRAAFVR